MTDFRELVSRHDVVYPTPPTCWQDGLLMGNGALGALYFAPNALHWIVNKTDVLDARTATVRRIIPPKEAEQMARGGATVADFAREEIAAAPPQGAGPKSCCELVMELGYSGGINGHPSLPAIASRLGLYDATLRVELDKHLFHPRVESFVDAHSNLLSIRVRDVSPLVNRNTRLIFTRPEDLQLGEPMLRIERNCLLMKLDLPEAGHYVAGIQVVPRPGTAYRELMRARLRPQHHAPDTGGVSLQTQGRFGFIHVDGDFDVFLAVATTRDADDPWAEVHWLLDRAAADDFQERHRAHAGWWAQFWSRSRIELGDQNLERECYRSLYALGTTYRAGKTPLAGLCGLAYGPDVGPIQVTPWLGDLHHDLNVECPFFPVFALNHGDLAEAYFETYLSFLPQARQLARDVWQADGAHFDMCVNALGRPIMGGVGTYRFYFGGSYLGLIFCLAWRFNRDLVQLRQTIYPFLKEILSFYLAIAKRDEHGIYHFHPAHAPEINLVNVGDPVQVVSMLKICLDTAIEASERLNLDPAERARWRNLRQHLPAYPTATDPRGRTVVVDGVGIPADHHLSQAACLMPIYPCGEVDELSEPKRLALYEATFDSAVEKIAYHSYAVETGSYFIGGHPMFFTGMTALRLGRVEDFWQKYFRMLLRGCGKASGLMSHNPSIVVDPARSEKNLENIPDETLCDVGERMPKWEAWCGHNGFSSPNPRSKELCEPLIEANADFLTMLVETLLQSHNGIIRVFPGWPRDVDARFDNLVAEGNIAVSASLRNGSVEIIRLQRRSAPWPPHAAQARVRSPWTGKVMSLALPVGKEVDITKETCIR